MVAEDNVHVEQFPLASDPNPASRKMNCHRLTAKFTPEGRLETALAEQHVTGEQEEIRHDRPAPMVIKLSADRMRAFFRGFSNRVDRVEAEKDVIFIQDQRIAEGTKAVYTDATGLMELTGNPTATMPEGQIIEADRLVWDRVHARLISRGKFKSEWKRPPADTNRLAAPVVQAQPRP
jgi:hypothetical protein